MTPSPHRQTDLLDEIWRFELRPDGVYVSVEEIGGQGELGPFADRDQAKLALLRYLRDDIEDPLRAREP